MIRYLVSSIWPLAYLMSVCPRRGYLVWLTDSAEPATSYELRATKKRWTMVLAGITFLLCPSLAMAQADPISLEHADYLEYRRAEGKVNLRGDVRLRQGEVSIAAQEIDYDILRSQLTARGEVVVRQLGTELRGEYLFYDVQNQLGELRLAEIYSPPWRIKCPVVKKVKPDEIVMYRASCTTCDLDRPHYSFRARKIRLVMDRKLTARSVTFYADGVPIFYLPYFYRSLRDRRIPFLIDIGHTDYLGTYVKTQFNYFFNPRQYGSTYFDYFKKQGFGHGVYHLYNVPGHNGDLYFYRVDESRGSRRARWASRWKHDGQVRRLWDLETRASLNLTSDEPFRHHYAVADRGGQFDSQRRASLSLAKKFPFGSIRLLEERQDYYNQLKGEFEKQSVLNPQVGVTLIPNKMLTFLPFLLSASSTFEHRWTLADMRYRDKASGASGISFSYRPYRWLTLSDATNWNYTWQERFPGETGREFQHYFRTTPRIKNNIGRSVETGVGYSWGKELLRGFHGGRETISLLDSNIAFYWKQLVKYKIWTNYNFLLKRENYKENFGYLEDKLTIQPGKRYRYSLGSQYSIAAKDWRSVTGKVDIYGREIWRYTVKVEYDDGRVTTTGRNPAGGRLLRMDMGLKFIIFNVYRLGLIEQYDLRKGTFKGQSYEVYRDLHCWEASMRLDVQPMNTTLIPGRKRELRFSFKLNMKALPKYTFGYKKTEWERYRKLQGEEALRELETQMTR